LGSDENYDAIFIGPQLRRPSQKVRDTRPRIVYEGRVDDAPQTKDLQQPPGSLENERAGPFAQKWVRIIRQDRIDLKWRAS